MSARARVLEALLGSISAELPTRACLDATLDGIGSAVLMKRGVICHVEPRRGEVGYDLVICEEAGLARAAAHLGDAGSLLMFSASEPRDAKWRAAGLASVARVRCPEGHWRLMVRTGESGRPKFAVSLVVVCQDQVTDLALLAHALSEEPPEPSWELIVVDRGSFDATAELLRRLDGDVQAVRTTRGTAHTSARAQGIAAANGEIIIVIDPTLTPMRGFVSAVRQVAESNPHANVFAGTVADGGTGRVVVRGCDSDGRWIVDPGVPVAAPTPMLMGLRLAATHGGGCVQVPGLRAFTRPPPAIAVGQR